MQISKLLAPFYPDENAPIWLRTFDAKGLPKELTKRVVQLKTSRNELANDTTVQVKLTAINQQQGIYFVVNPGGNSDEEITSSHVVFCEMDDRPLAEQHRIMDEFIFPPSIRFETRKSVHCYWLLKDDITPEKFTAIQERLILQFASDKSLHNPSRVMRVPLYNHVHYQDGEFIYKPIAVHTFEPRQKYSSADIESALPQLQRAVKKVWSPLSLDDREGVMVELRHRIMQTPEYRSHGEWGCTKGICHNGEGNNGLRINLASGIVSCWTGCKLKEIASAFNLQFPEKGLIGYAPKRKQTSELYQFLQDSKLDERYAFEEFCERIAIETEHLENGQEVYDERIQTYGQAS